MKNTMKTLVVIFLAVITFSCDKDDEPEAIPPVACANGISYKLDGVLVNYDNALITAEIHNDVTIGKFYDIWTDENSGFYYHSTITETGRLLISGQPGLLQMMSQT